MEPSTPFRVANPPARPLLLFDGNCGFCRAWVARWRSALRGRVDVAPSQEAGVRFPEIPGSEFRRSVQLVLSDGRVFSGAHAIFAALAQAGRPTPLWIHRHIPGAAAISEALYGAVARHRQTASAVTRALWGKDVSSPRFGVASAIFLRLLGLVFLAAFVSAWVQIHGLIGSKGILPIAPLLDAVRGRQYGLERFWWMPTLLWAASGDAALHVFCAAGALSSILLLAGMYPAACVAVCGAIYLSLSVAGQLFFSYQWDYLLVETAFLAFLLAPATRRARFPAASPGPSRIALFLLRWLLFRLNFTSGVVKLSSGDPTWRHLTALDFHFETQPLPSWTAWFAHQWPPGVHRAFTLALFAFELGVPFLIFGPPRVRRAACVGLVSLQVFIAATGNYAFFNLLTALLAILLLDDRVFDRWRRVSRPEGHADAAPVPQGRRRRIALAGAAAIVLPLSVVHFADSFGGNFAWPSPVRFAARTVSPLRIVNGYGLFAVMTTQRSEIELQGSADGQTWKSYAFRWKPGDLLRRPGFVAPHQPRLDWQMWFAALGSEEENPWVAQLEDRLIEGSPPVLALFASNPFSGAPPRFVRATSWNYRFTDPRTRAATGAWWRREKQGPYGPVRSRP